MNRSVSRALLATAMVIPAYGSAHEFSPVNAPEELCYGRAMIGFDSVINSRLGVPAEHALNLARLKTPSPQEGSTIYSKALLNTIWDAYLWQDTPHSYALKVFYRCATEQPVLRNAMSDWIVAEGY